MRYSGFDGYIRSSFSIASTRRALFSVACMQEIPVYIYVLEHGISSVRLTPNINNVAWPHAPGGLGCRLSVSVRSGSCFCGRQNDRVRNTLPPFPNKQGGNIT